MINDTETIVKPEIQEEQNTHKATLLSDIVWANKKIVVGLIALFSMFICAYKFILPNYINTSTIHKITQESLKDGYNLDIKGLKANLSWDLALVLDVDNIDLAQGQKKLLHSEEATLKVPLVMLLFKKFDNTQFFSKSVTANIERDKNGVLNLKKAFKFKDSTTEISKFRIAIKNYDITFVDYNSAPIILNGYNFDLGNLKLYRLKTFGTILFPDNTRTILNINFISKKPLDKGQFILKGNVDNFDLKKIEKYLIEFNPEFTKASGSLNGDFNIDAYGREKITNNLKLSLNSNNVIVSTKKYPHFFEIADNAQIFAEGKYYNYKLNFKKFRIISGNYNLECSGIVKNINKKSRKLNIKVRVKDSNIKKLLGLVPKTVKVKHDGVNKSVKHNIDGIVNTDLLIKGDTESLKYYGTVKIKQLAIGSDFSKSKSYADLVYKKRKLTLNSHLVDKDGGIIETKGTSFMGRRPKINFKIDSKKFALDEMQKNVVALSDVLELSIGILPDMKLDGTARANLLIKGRGANINTDGTLYLIKANIGHNQISNSVLVENQNLELKKRSALFKNFVSSMDTHKTTLNGYISLDNKMNVNLDSPNFPISLALSIVEKSPLLEEVKKGLDFIDSSAGNINLKINFVKDEFGNIKSKGLIQLLDNSLTLKDFSAKISNCLGIISFDGHNCYIQNMTAKALGSPISVVAQVKNKKINAKITAPSLDSNSVIQSILTSKALSAIVPVFKDIDTSVGHLSANLYLKGSSKEDLFDKVECHIISNKLYLKNALAPITVVKGDFIANKNEFKATKIIMNFLNAKCSLDGTIRNFGQKPDCNLNVDIFNIDNSVFNALKNSNLESGIKKLLGDFSDFSGSASGHISVRKKITGKISFNNLGVRYLPAGLPLYIKAGDMIIADNKMTLSNSQMQIGGSKFKINANFNANKSLGVELTGDLSPEDVDKYLNKILVTPFNLKQTTPVKLNFKKEGVESWKLLAGLVLAPGNMISYKDFLIGDKSSAYLVGGGVTKNHSQIQFENLGVHQLPNPIFESLNLNNLLSHKNYFELSGWINQKNLDENLKIYARDFMDINIFNQFLDKKSTSRLFYGGNFKGDLLLKGKIDSPLITGYVDIEGAKIPSYKTTVKNLKIIFEKDYIRFENCLLKIAGSELKIDAIAENLIDIPYVFKEMNIHSDYIDIDEITKIIQNNSGQFSSGRPLFVVKHGTLAAKKLIINNLITDNALIDFCFTPDWIITLDKFSFSTAGGEVIGNSSLDFSTKCSKAYMKFRNLKANAAATTLLQMPNEIYGVLNGEARFTTKGFTRSDMVKNSNGAVKFQITSGRLVRLGSLEYLLMAAEVIKSGVTGLSINNVFTLITPKKTGHFDTINVNFNVKNGVLFTDDLVSRGENLNIYLAGNFDMTTNYSDFTILGRVSKSVIRILGPIGDLSLNKVINSIPGVEDSICDKFSLPGINLSDKDHRRFVVNIEGDLYNQKSVKNFKWID